MIYIIDDDEIMAECIARGCRRSEVRKFSNAIEAMQRLDEDLNNDLTPKLIFLDILLDGPDGFTFLNELMSYSDTARIPVVIVSTLDFKDKDLSVYGVVGVLDKTTMTPKEIEAYVREYA